MEGVQACVLNPADGAILERSNRTQDVINHSVQRGIRNADNYDRYLDHMTLRNERFANAVENLALLQNAVETDSAGNENEKNQQDSDTDKNATDASVTAASITLGNIASAMAPALVQAGQPLTVLGLALALPAAIAAAQKAAAAAPTTGS